MNSESAPHSRRHFIKMSSGIMACAMIPEPVKGLFSRQTATITVHAGQVTATISPLIYGQFIEHLGRAIDGGIYEEGSSLSNPDGFRKDVLEKVKALRPPLMRYPGGTVTKIYHWKDGIGPVAQRPVRRNLIWGGEDNNHVGTDEFMSYSKQIDAAPFLTVNMSTGTAEEASDWVEYCNADGNSYFAALRKKNGHAAPYNVQFWGLGNEEGAKEDAGILQNPADYAKQAWYYAKLMKLQDPEIALIMAGDTEEWNKVILQELHPICDYISLHLYASSRPGKPASLFTSIATMEEKIINTAAQIKALTPPVVDKFNRWYRFPARKAPVKIALDEWGIWESGGKGAYDLEVEYNWNHALGVATFLNIFQRHADVIGLATWAQTVNVLAPIMTSKEALVCQTIYYPLELYRRLCGNQHVPADVQCNLLEADGVPVLDVATSIDEASGMLTIAMVNRDSKGSVDVQLKIEDRPTKGKWTVHELNAVSIDAVNTLQSPGKNVVDYQVRSLPADTRTYTIAAHSIAILQVLLLK